jgi:hypothetical protein
MDLLASASRIEQAFVDAKYLDTLTASRPALFAALDDRFDRTTINKNEVLDRDAVTYPFALLNLLKTRQALLDFMSAWHFPGLVAYAAEPIIAVQRDRLRMDADGAALLVTSLDILSNPVRAIDTRATLPGDRAPYFRLAQGVVDTLAEYLVLGGGEAVNAHSVLARAVAENSPLILLTADDSAALASIEAGPTEKAAIEADLARGFAVLAPARAVALAGKPAFAWWRADPRSGAALGIGAEGQGQSLTERVIIDGVVIGTICAGFTWYETRGTNASAGSSFVKCMVISIILVPVGIGLHKLASVLVRRIAVRLGLGAAAAGAAGAAAGGAAARGTAAGEAGAGGAGARGGAAGEAGAAGGGKVRSGPTEKAAIEVPGEPQPSGSGQARSGAGESGSGTVAVGRRDGQTLPGAMRNPAVEGGQRGGAFEAAGGGRGPARGAREPAPGQEPARGSGKFDEAAIDRVAKAAGERAATWDVEPKIDPAKAANDAVISAAKGLDQKAMDMGIAWHEGVPLDKAMKGTGMNQAEARAALDRFLERTQGVTDKAARDKAIRDYEAIQNYEGPKPAFVDNPLAQALKLEAEAARLRAEAAARAQAESYDPFRDMIPVDEGIPLSESDIRSMGQAPEPPRVDPSSPTAELPRPGTETQPLPNPANPQ